MSCFILASDEGRCRIPAAFELLDTTSLCPPVSRHGNAGQFVAKPVEPEDAVRVSVEEIDHFAWIIALQILLRAHQILLPYLDADEIGMEAARRP